MSTAFAPVDNVGASPPGHATVRSLPLAWSKGFQLLIGILIGLKLKDFGYLKNYLKL